MNIGITSQQSLTGNSSVTQKGQVTIPQEIRTKMGIKAGDRVSFAVEGEAVTLKPVASNLLAAYGAVSPTQRPEDFSQIRNQFELGIAKEVASEG